MASDIQELELQMVIKHYLVLRIELRSSGKVASALNHETPLQPKGTSQLSVTPAPQDPTSSSALSSSGALHTCGEHTEMRQNSHPHEIVSKMFIWWTVEVPVCTKQPFWLRNFIHSAELHYPQ